jgi:uncharacterized phage protein (TIGR01671 family)
MNRQILFRGLRTNGKGWAYGDLYKGREAMYILLKKAPCESEKHGLPFSPVEVHPHTVGQFTGLLDKNGVKVFEGDIIHSDNWNPSTYKVIFEDGEFCFVSLNESEKPYTNSINYVKDFQIIGNIHEPDAQP